jgi:hypothetical protein
MNTTTMSAGRELDALVAKKVMESVPCDKWRQFTDYPVLWVKNTGECNHTGCYPSQEGPPYYSTSIAAAWEVVEKMRFNVWCLCGSWEAGYPLGPVRGNASTAPLAICRAALKAVAV